MKKFLKNLILIFMITFFENGNCMDKISFNSKTGDYRLETKFFQLSDNCFDSTNINPNYQTSEKTKCYLNFFDKLSSTATIANYKNFQNNISNILENGSLSELEKSLENLKLYKDKLQNSDEWRNTVCLTKAKLSNNKTVKRSTLVTPRKWLKKHLDIQIFGRPRTAIEKKVECEIDIFKKKIKNIKQQETQKREILNTEKLTIPEPLNIINKFEEIKKSKPELPKFEGIIINEPIENLTPINSKNTSVNFSTIDDMSIENVTIQDTNIQDTEINIEPEQQIPMKMENDYIDTIILSENEDIGIPNVTTLETELTDLKPNETDVFVYESEPIEEPKTVGIHLSNTTRRFLANSRNIATSINGYPSQNLFESGKNFFRKYSQSSSDNNKKLDETEKSIYSSNLSEQFNSSKNSINEKIAPQDLFQKIDSEIDMDQKNLKNNIIWAEQEVNDFYKQVTQEDPFEQKHFLTDHAKDYALHTCEVVNQGLDLAMTFCNENQTVIAKDATDLSTSLLNATKITYNILNAIGDGTVNSGKNFVGRYKENPTLVLKDVGYSAVIVTAPQIAMAKLFLDLGQFGYMTLTNTDTFKKLAIKKIKNFSQLPYEEKISKSVEVSVGFFLDNIVQGKALGVAKGLKGYFKNVASLVKTEVATCKVLNEINEKTDCLKKAVMPVAKSFVEGSNVVGIAEKHGVEKVEEALETISQNPELAKIEKNLYKNVDIVVKEGVRNNKEKISQVIKKTSTVWDYIEATDEMYPGTKIPRSFRLKVNDIELWIAPNATKHMKEYLDRLPARHSLSIESQIILKSFHAAINKASKFGLIYGDEIVIGQWGFVFSPPRENGLLSVVKHAIYRP